MAITSAVRRPDIVARVRAFVAADRRAATNDAIAALIWREFKVPATPGKIAGMIAREKISRGAITDRDMRWSEARKAVMRERYAISSTRALTDELNALPGEPLTSHIVKSWAMNHDLRKDPDVKRVGRPPSQRPKQAPKPRPPRPGILSPERAALVREKYPTMKSRGLLHAVNALPGPEITMEQMTRWAENRKLRKLPEGLTRKPAAPKPLPSAPVSSGTGIARPHALPFRILSLSKPGVVTHRPGRCRWPLTCDGSAARNWCAEHAALLRSRESLAA